MITLKELNPKNYTLTPEQETNITILHERMNKVREAYGKPMTVTSGVRSLEHHIAVYKRKGITDPKLIPMASNHLKAAACDIADSSGELYKWCKENEALLAEIGLWMEEGTKGWVHFQVFPPKSGKRWFLP